MDLSVVPYGCSSERGGGARYGECMRNHAAARGGQAFDGCGEFMAGGAAGSPESLKCAACGCHRSFHRRDGAATQRRPILQPIAYLPPPPPLPLTYHPMPPQMAPPAQLDRSRSGSETPPRADEAMANSGGGRKRYRTKFTAEQKERMKEFAESLGWRIQRHDDGALERFCLEIGVDRHVLKVWMHNHKNQMATPGSGGGGTGGMGVETVALTGGASGGAASAGAAVEAAAIRV